MTATCHNFLRYSSYDAAAVNHGGPGTGEAPKGQGQQENAEMDALEARGPGHGLRVCRIAVLPVLPRTDLVHICRLVKQQDFDPVTPFRADFTPGTLLSVGKSRDRVAMEAATFLDGNLTTVTQAKVPDVVLDLNLNAAATGEGTGVNFSSNEDLKAALVLSDINVLTLSLDRVRDRVKGNTRVEEALERNPSDLFVILKALQVGKIRLKFNDARKISAKIQSVTDRLKVTFGLSGALDRSDTVQSNAPMILGIVWQGSTNSSTCFNFACFTAPLWCCWGQCSTD